MVACMQGGSGKTAAAVLCALRERGAAGVQEVAAATARLTEAAVAALSDTALLRVMHLVQRLSAHGAIEISSLKMDGRYHAPSLRLPWKPESHRTRSAAALKGLFTD
jgi:hypothetical protein